MVWHFRYPDLCFPGDLFRESLVFFKVKKCRAKDFSTFHLSCHSLDVYDALWAHRSNRVHSLDKIKPVLVSTIENDVWHFVVKCDVKT